MVHNKTRNPLLNLLINCISTRSAPQTLSLKNVYTFRFSNFLTIGLCNSSANCLFDKISSLTPAIVDLLSKKFLKHCRKAS